MDSTEEPLQTSFSQDEHWKIFNRLPISEERRTLLLKRLIGESSNEEKQEKNNEAKTGSEEKKMESLDASHQTYISSSDTGKTDYL